MRRNPLLLVTLAVLTAVPLTRAADMENLALKKPASASGSEANNPPENAVDNDDETRWCNDSDSADCWWQVDLKEPHPLAGCQILWEHDDTTYNFIIEGSADGKTWLPLNDQRGSHWTAQLQKLQLDSTTPVRFVRIKFTELAEGSWASFFEFKLFDAAAMKTLPPDAAKAFKLSAPLPAASTQPAK